jgi:hypothetical protein
MSATMTALLTDSSLKELYDSNGGNRMVLRVG